MHHLIWVERRVPNGPRTTLCWGCPRRRPVTRTTPGANGDSREERELSRLDGLKEIEHCTRRRRLCTAPKNTAGLLGGLPDSVCLQRNPGIRISKSKEPVVRHIENEIHTEDSNTLARRKGRLGAATCVPQIICYRVSHLLPSQLI